MKLFKLLGCHLLGTHEWTTPYMERGEKVDMNQVRLLGTLESFRLDNEQYCRICGKDRTTPLAPLEKQKKKNI